MASASGGCLDGEQARSTPHELLDAMVELAQACHFCGTFQAPLKLPSFSRTDLQAALVAGTKGDDRQVALLAEVHFKLVREQGAKLERMIQDWEKAVARKVTDNWRLEFSSNPLNGVAYDDLTVAQRIQILNVLCHWKLESCAEIQKYLAALQKDPDPKALEALRATPIGYDDAGSAYWYFGDCCWIYAENRPAWQSQRQHEYAVEFADAKRIRLSINFDPTRSSPELEDLPPAAEESVAPPVVNGDAVKIEDAPKSNKMEILSLVNEEIDEEEEDEPLPTMKSEAMGQPSNVEATMPPAVREVAKSESRKMDITMLCGSPPTTETPPKPEPMDIATLCGSPPPPLPTTSSSPKPEPMEEDEHDVSEDRFMSTIVSTRDRVEEPTADNAIKVAEEKSVASELASVQEVSIDNTIVPESAPTGDVSVDAKKRRLNEDDSDLADKSEEKATEMEPVAPPKRRKTRFHDIVKPFETPAEPVKQSVDKKHSTLTIETGLPTAPTEDSTAKLPVDDQGAENGGQAEDFDILCAACQRSYDRRYLDPPLDKRPLGEWRCFECLVNDARGWPRRRNPPSRSPKEKAAEAAAEDDETNARRKSGSSSKRSKSRSTSSKSGSTKKSSSSRSSSSKKGSSSAKKSSKKHKKSPSSSSKTHSSSTSSRHHHNHSRHREEFAKLLKLAHTRKRERRAIEDERLDGAHLCPVSVDGPSDWRVVCCSVDGLRHVIEKLAGGSLEQDRLRGRLILILKTEEKMEMERIKKQQLWQIMPRRQSSRVAMGRIKSHTSSGDSGDDSDGESQRRPSRSRTATNGVDSRQRHAHDRESRAKRRRLGEDSPSDSDSEANAHANAHAGVRSVDGWINWSDVSGEESLKMVCSGVIERLLKEEIAELFARPVDPEEDGCPDYLTVIEHPMDLGTIQKRVDNGFYSRWELFRSDVTLVWSNCRKYNSPDTVVVEYADTLDEMFQQMRKQAERNGIRKMGKNTNPAKPADGAVASEDGSEEEDVDVKSKSASSASELSSDDSSDSSDGHGSSDDDGDGHGGSKSKRSSRAARSTRTSARPPSRPSRSSKPSPSSRRASRRKSKKEDSEEEEEEDEADSDSESELEVLGDTDDSDAGRRRRNKRSAPPRRRGSNSSSASAIAAGEDAMDASRAPPRASESTPPPPTAQLPLRRNRVESSDSSSSEGSLKGDSSSSSDDSDADEDAPLPSKTEPVPAPAPEPLGAPPPPSPPPPPPPPSSNPSDSTTPTRSSRKPKPAANRKLSADHSDSSSSYFSTSDSDSSGNGSDSSDSD